MDIQQKTQTAVANSNKELAKQTQVIGQTAAASKSLADTSQKNVALYNQLTQSLQKTSGEQKKFIENLLSMNLDQVEAEIKNLGMTTEQYVAALAKATNTADQTAASQNKIAAAADKATLEFTEQAGAIRVSDAASKKLAETNAKNAQLYAALSASLEKATGEQKEFIQNLLNTPMDQVRAEIEAAGMSLDQYIQSLNNTDKATVNVKQRLTELKKELNSLALQGKQNTAEFRALAAEAGELQDQLGDVNATIKALGSDTGAIDGIIDAVGGLAGAFAAVQGAQALFADENEDLQKALLKVSAAMSLLQGIQQIQNVLQKESAASVALLQFQQKLLVVQTNLQTAAESRNVAVRYAAITAQKILNAVMAANPIGLVVTAVVTLTAALIAYANSSKKAAEEQGKLNAALASADQLLDAEVKGFENANKKIVSDLEARGAKQSEIERQNQNTRKKTLEATERELAQLQQALNNSSAEDKADALAKVQELEERAYDLRTEVYVGENKVKQALNEENTKRTEKALADRQKLEEEAQQKREERAKAEIDAAKQLQDIKNKIILDGINNEFEKRRVAVQQQLSKEIEDVRANELLKAETREALIKGLNEKAARDLAQINKDQRDKEMEAEKQFQTELAQLTEQITLNNIKDVGERELQAIKFNYERQRQAILDDTSKTYEQKTQLVLALNKLEADELAKQDLANRQAAAERRLKGINDVIDDTNIAKDIRLKAIRDERVLLVNLYAQGVLDREQYNDKLKELSKQEGEINKVATEDFKKQQEERLAKIKKVSDAITEYAAQTVEILGTLFSQQSERQLQNIDDQRQRIQELNETGAITAREAERRLKKLDAEERKVKTEQAKRDKAIAIFNVLINTARAVTAALTSTPPNIPLAIAVGVIGAAQAALVASKPIPKFAKGKKDGYQGLGEVGEAGPEIIQMGKVRYLATKPTIVWLNREDKVFTAKETKNIISKEYQSPVISIDKASGYLPSVDRSVTNYNSTQTEEKIIPIDYGLMGESIAKAIPKYGLNINERGFSEWVRKGNSFIQYLDKRRAI